MSEQTVQPPVAGAAADKRPRGCVWLAAGMLSACLAVVLLAWLHAVPLRVTGADREALKAILGGPIARPDTGDYAAQLAEIHRIQEAVARAAPTMAPIPHGQTREPGDLLRWRRGLCYDRSRTLEKALRAAGFRVRHAAIYALDPDASKVSLAMNLAFKRELPSHSASECLTAKGWLVVDSNHSWLALDGDRRPLSLRDLRNMQSTDGDNWRTAPDELIYRRPFIYIYGLYSRHGRFYPPFNVVPDVSWRELLAIDAVKQSVGW